MFIIFISLIYACDENSNSGSDLVDPVDPVDDQPRCFTPQEVSASECPAEELTNMCTTYSCNFMIGNVVADGSFPPCPADTNSCEFIDCTTLMCGDSLFFDISAGENGLGYSFDSVDQSSGEIIEVRVVCHEGGIFSFSCGEDGTIFN